MATETIRSDFAGAGGMATGLRLAGFTGRILCVEQNEYAAATARAAGFEVHHGDVRDIPTMPLLGYTAGPPCQTYSSAGSRSGVPAVASIAKAVRLVADGASPNEAVAQVHDEELDERTVLALHPLTVIRDSRPRFVILEQVRAVRPIWEAYAEVMQEWGYAVRVHTLHSEQYGVPQTRIRVGLVAALGNFDPADLEPVATHSRYYPRNPAKLDAGVLPWISLGEALGRAETMRSNYGTGGDASNRGERTADQPAPTVTGKVGRNKWVPPHMGDGNFRFLGAGATAPTTAGQRPREAIEPAHTITGAGSATFVPVAGAPVRVTVEQAAILQSFPAGHPWQGPKTAQYQQVGNAVPPLMAKAVAEPLLRLVRES